MNPLTLLSSLLARAANSTPVALRQGTEIDEQIDRLEKQRRAGSRAYEPRDLQVEAVKRFWKSPHFESLRDARLVSFGLGLDASGDKRCLMEDRKSVV